MVEPGHTLFGVRIPEGARVVEVSLAAGARGRTRIMFRGPIERGDSHVITEDEVADHVAQDGKFWEYVCGLVEAGTLPEQRGVWEFTVRVAFVNAEGVPAVLDQATGKTHATSPEPYSFHRSKGKAGGDATSELLRTVITELVRSNQHLHQELPKLLTSLSSTLANVGKDVTTTAAAEAAKLLAAGSAPLNTLIERLTDLSKGETARANKTLEALTRMLHQKAEDSGDDWADTVLKLAPLLPMLERWLSKLNDKGMPN